MKGRHVIFCLSCFACISMPPALLLPGFAYLWPPEALQQIGCSAKPAKSLLPSVYSKQPAWGAFHWHTLQAGADAADLSPPRQCLRASCVSGWSAGRKNRPVNNIGQTLCQDSWWDVPHLLAEGSEFWWLTRRGLNILLDGASVMQNSWCWQAILNK